MRMRLPILMVPDVKTITRVYRFIGLERCDMNVERRKQKKEMHAIVKEPMNGTEVH